MFFPFPSFSFHLLLLTLKPMGEFSWMEKVRLDVANVGELSLRSSTLMVMGWVACRGGAPPSFATTSRRYTARA